MLALTGLSLRCREGAGFLSSNLGKNYLPVPVIKSHPHSLFQGFSSVVVASRNKFSCGTISLGF